MKPLTGTKRKRALDELARNGWGWRMMDPRYGPDTKTPLNVLRDAVIYQYAVAKKLAAEYL